MMVLIKSWKGDIFVQLATDKVVSGLANEGRHEVRCVNVYQAFNGAILLVDTEFAYEVIEWPDGKLRARYASPHELVM